MSRLPPGACCEDCGTEFSPAVTVYQRVSGWVPITRHGGGANQISLKEGQNRFLCDGCIRIRRRAAKRGGDPSIYPAAGQESLL